MRHIKLIIGILVVFAFLLAAAVAFSGEDYLATIDTELQTANDFQQKHDHHKELARLKSCEYIGELLSSCSKRRQSSCEKLRAAKESHSENFEESADACFEEPITVAGQDPMLFGDE